MTALSIVIAIFGTIISFHLHMIGTALMDLRELFTQVYTEEDDSEEDD